jgi:DNA-binding NarL/FixJ family response regulator
MSLASFLVLEKKGRWAADFRRHLSATEIRVREIRSYDECWDELRAAPASLVAIEVSRESLLRSWTFLSRVSREFADARTLVLTSAETAEWRWAWQDAGVVDVVFSWSQVARIVPIITRHLAMYPSRDRSFRQQIEDRLPWPDRITPPS